jgi:hypothetical protein
MKLDELKYHVCESNASTEQEMVWDEFLYCVDVVKLPLKFILSIYEVIGATVSITTNLNFVVQLICSIYIFKLACNCKNPTLQMPC